MTDRGIRIHDFQDTLESLIAGMQELAEEEESEEAADVLNNCADKLNIVSSELEGLY